MALEDLEREGMLLPRDEWGTRKLRSRVARIPMIVLSVVAVAGCVLMYVGNGNAPTWIGLGGFLVALAGFTWINLRAVK